MPSTLPENPEYIVRDILQNNWDATNTASYDPSSEPGASNWLPITLGWHESSAPHPQVTLSNFSEGVVSGGTTEYSGVMGDGSGPFQDRDGSGLINVWVADEGDYNDDLNAERLTYAIRSEIERIAQEQATPDATDFLYFGTRWDGRTVDSDVSPAIHQSQLTCSYGYIKTP